MVGLAYWLTNGAGEEHDRLYRRPICLGAVVLLLAIPLNVVFWYVCRSDCFFTALGLLLTMFGMFGIEDELRPFARDQCRSCLGNPSADV
jgi:hypothetical protein